MLTWHIMYAIEKIRGTLHPIKAADSMISRNGVFIE